MQKGKLIGQGRTAEIFEWDENKILKLFRNGFPKAAIENEFNIGLELCNKGLPIPEVYDLLEFDDRVGIVYERVNGPTMMNLLSSKPWKIVGEAQKLAELHKAIQIHVNAKIPPQKSRLKQSINDSKILIDKIKADLFEVLQNLPDGGALCHGDFHPDNIIITTNKTVVIDWMTATIGNPLSDVARTSIIFKFGAVPDHKSRIETSIINFEQWEVLHAAARLIEWIPPKEKEKLLGFVAAHFA